MPPEMRQYKKHQEFIKQAVCKAGDVVIFSEVRQPKGHFRVGSFLLSLRLLLRRRRRTAPCRGRRTTSGAAFSSAIPPPTSTSRAGGTPSTRSTAAATPGRSRGTKASPTRNGPCLSHHTSPTSSGRFLGTTATLTRPPARCWTLRVGMASDATRRTEAARPTKGPRASSCPRAEASFRCTSIQVQIYWIYLFSGFSWLEANSTNTCSSVVWPTAYSATLSASFASSTSPKTSARLRGPPSPRCKR